MENKAQKLLESLTPGGSEFYNDPEYCVKHIREHQQNQYELIVKLVTEKKALTASKNELLEALKEIESYCDNQNSDHEVFWRIAYNAIKKATE